MNLTPVETQLKKIAYYLGILQGLAYSILALICIILYHKGVPYHIVNSYMDLVNENIYVLFLGPYHRSFPDHSLYPDVFAGFAYVYLILHLGWLGLSVEALRRKGVTQLKDLTSWSYLTLFISLWDFITVVILGSDYKKCVTWAEGYPFNILEKVGAEGVCANGILPVLVIAARGFVLWFINVIFAVFLWKMASRLKKGVQPTFQSLVPIVFQYPQYPGSLTNGYNAQPPQSAQYVNTAPQNVNRNQFEYPVHIPEPDYYPHQQEPSPAKKY